MALLKEICDYADELLDVPGIPDFCPNGLQIEGRKEVKTLVSAVSASLETIEAAVEDPEVDALLVHHGFFWKGEDARIVGTKRKKIQQLLEKEVSLIVYHLPLDVHPELGNNGRAAEEMGWTNRQTLGRYNGIPMGVQGEFDECSIAEFVQKVGDYYGSHVHTALGGPSRVSSAGLISGGAHRSITDAVKAGVDCFITGSFDEPIWHIAKEEGIHFLAVGHSNSEKVGPRTLGEHLARKFQLNHRFLDLPNPF